MPVIEGHMYVDVIGQRDTALRTLVTIITRIRIHDTHKSTLTATLF